MRSILPAPSTHFVRRIYLLRTAILLYEYCLTFVAEVERCWGSGRLSWALGLFYLNRYLVLFGHVPIMYEYFWESSDQSKAEVSLRSLPNFASRWILTYSIVDVNIYPSKLAMKSNHIIYAVVPTSKPFTNT